MTAKIPKHWKIKTLGEIANISSGTTPFRKNPLFYDNADIPFVKTTDLNNSYITTTEEKVSMYALNNTSLRLYPTNTVLVAMYGGFNQIGRTGKLAMEATINQALSALVLKNDDVNSDYLLFWLNANVEKWKRFAGSSRKDPNINGKDVAEFSILIPSLEEQEKIAEILLTCDKAIRLTTQIITQLKQRNQGLAQQLLTGKKRVKGFENSVWKEVRLGDLLDYEQPTNYLVKNTDYSDEYKTPVLTAGKTFILGYTNEKEGICTKIPLILFDDFTTDSRYIDFSFKVKSSAVKLLKAKKNANLRFIFEAMKLIKYAIGGHERHWISKYAFLTIFVPSFKGQNAIAQILDTTHQELKLYEQKLQLLQAQKKTLMQKLLTGEVLTIKK